jgi:hypothetical protein
MAANPKTLDFSNVFRVFSRDNYRSGEGGGAPSLEVHTASGQVIRLDARHARLIHLVHAIHDRHTLQIFSVPRDPADSLIAIVTAPAWRPLAAEPAASVANSASS